VQADCDQQVPKLAGHKSVATLGDARYKSKGVHHIGRRTLQLQGKQRPSVSAAYCYFRPELDHCLHSTAWATRREATATPAMQLPNAETQHTSSLQPGPKHGCRHPSIHMHCAPLGRAAARAACAPALFVRHQAAAFRSSWQPAYQGTLIHHPDTLTLTRSISAACRWSSCRAQRAPARLLACAAGGRPARAVRLARGPAAHALLLHLRAVRPARRAGTLSAGATPCERRRAPQRCLARERRSAGPTHHSGATALSSQNSLGLRASCSGHHMCEAAPQVMPDTHEAPGGFFGVLGRHAPPAPLSVCHPRPPAHRRRRAAGRTG